MSLPDRVLANGESLQVALFFGLFATLALVERAFRALPDGAARAGEAAAAGAGNRGVA